MKSLNKGERVYYVIFFLLIGFRVWIISGVPKMYLYAPHDDLYYAKIAHYIIHGQWLGPYDQMTIIKAPFYAFFLIFSFLTGLPLYLNETIFYVLGCIILFFAISPVVKNRWWKLFLFAIVLYNPASSPNFWMIRVYREFVYLSLNLYILAFGVGLFLRLEEKKVVILGWALGLGLSLGAFMITREEGVWIYPSILFLLLLGIFKVFKEKYTNRWMRSGLLLLPILLGYIPTFLISFLNYHHYGYWGVTEQLDRDFSRALDALDRITPENEVWHPAIQISHAAREEAYAVSPLFASLRDEIESIVPLINVYDNQSMSYKPEWYLREYGDGGSEIGSHFLWLLRDVVCHKGHCENATTTKEFYKQLADEIESACDSGTLVCSSNKSVPFIGLIDQKHYSIILRMFFTNLSLIQEMEIQRIMSENVLNISKWPSSPDFDESFKLFEQFAYNPVQNVQINSTNNPIIVSGKIDLRYRILPLKEKIIVKISEVYRIISKLGFIFSFILWIIWVCFLLIKRQFGDQISIFGITFFVFSLFIIRLLTLTIVDATTSVAGIIYGPSLYIFAYVFFVLAPYGFFISLEKILKT